MNSNRVMLREAPPISGAAMRVRRIERSPGQKSAMVFDGSNDPEVCCQVCGAFLGRNSERWWDDYTCTFCHDRH